MLAELNTLELDRLKAMLLSADELKLAASLLYQSYHDDPLFMEIFRADKPDYEQRLRAAIREELNTFWQARQPMIGLFNGEQLLGVACVIAPDSGIGAGRLWHWRLKMLLTAGYVSTKQLLEKEQKIHAAMPAERYHMLAFIAVAPKQQHLGLGHYLIHAVDSIVDKDQHSAGIGVFVTLEKYQAFFADDKYQPVTELAFNTVSGTLMFRPRQRSRRSDVAGGIKPMNKFSSFAEFYPYYLSEHQNPVCRALHYIGSALVIAVLLYALFTQQWRWLWLLPVIGYGFAWLGHFMFEHNKPATFQYPFYSLAADWVMLKDFVTGQLKRKLPAN